MALSEEDDEDEASIAKTRSPSNLDDGGYEQDAESGEEHGQENTANNTRAAAAQLPRRSHQISETMVAETDEPAEQAPRVSHSISIAPVISTEENTLPTLPDGVSSAHGPSAGVSVSQRPGRGRSTTLASITSRFRLPTFALQSPASNAVPSINSGTAPVNTSSSRPDQIATNGRIPVRSLHETMPTLTVAQKR